MNATLLTEEAKVGVRSEALPRDKGGGGKGGDTEDGEKIDAGSAR